MAKTYIEAHNSPTSNPKVLILDEGASIGGTWAAERLYPNLKTNNVVGTYEFSDFPMSLDRYDLQPGQHIPGRVVHQYLRDFAKHFQLDQLIRLRTKVDTVALQDDDNGTWLVEYTTTSPPERPRPTITTTTHQRQQQLLAQKLVLATGVTSIPNLPHLPGQSSFCGAIFHVKDLPSYAHTLFHPHQQQTPASTTTTITTTTNNNNSTNSSSSSSPSKQAGSDGGCDMVVLGGNKSALDVCYAAATARPDAKVHMVVRRGGGGPGWVWWPLRFPLGFGFGSMGGSGGGVMTLAQLSSTRAFAVFDPAPFGRVNTAGKESGWGRMRGFLHCSVLGRWVTGVFWAVLGWLVEAVVGYRAEELRMLRPWTGMFSMGNSLSVHNYETDWFGLVRSGRIEVHHAEVVEVGGRTVRLSDGGQIKADTIVCCTGWDCAPTIEFKPDWVPAELGLPGSGVGEEDSAVIADVRRRLVRCYPVLARSQLRRQSLGVEVNGELTAAALIETRGVRTPYRLYRFLVPPSPRFLKKRNFAVIGAHRAVHAVIVAQCQALWITAYFQNKLPALRSLEPKTAHSRILWHTEYERLRRPRQSGGSGARFPDLVFDSIQYVDMLLEDLGMQVMRKKTLWANILEPHTPRDYRGLTQEWIWKETCSETVADEKAGHGTLRGTL